MNCLNTSGEVANNQAGVSFAGICVKSKQMGRTCKAKALWQQAAGLVGLQNSKWPAWQGWVEAGLGFVSAMFLRRVPYTREVLSKHL